MLRGNKYIYFLFILERESPNLYVLYRERKRARTPGTSIGTVAQLKYWQWISVPLSAAELRDVKS